MPNVKFVRKEVKDLLPIWKKVEDCIEGESAIKAADDIYLPYPGGEDDGSATARIRYSRYKKRAVFYNVSARTLAGLVGQVFMKPPNAELPALLAPLEVDIDGAGVSLEQQAKKALGYGLGQGRAGVFVDYPRTEGPASKADLDSGRIRPTINLYHPAQVINWRTRTIGAEKVLSLVVIEESAVAEDDGFEATYEDQWRVLYLDEGETYRVEIWREVDNQMEVTEQFTPTDSTGIPLKRIPFTFIGSENNDPEMDAAPLYAMAVLNLAHYRNSADYEESCHMVGQPTPYAAGLTKDWVEEVLGNKFNLGSRAVIPLPAGGTAGLLQAAPNTMPKEAMEAKERQMVALGAKLVEQNKVQRTASEADQEEASEASVLSTVANNVAQAYAKALSWASVFVGSPEEVVFELNTDFTTGYMTAQERAQLVAEWQSGAITYEEMRTSLKKSGVAYLEDEEAKDQIEQDDLIVTAGDAMEQMNPDEEGTPEADQVSGDGEG